MGRKTIERCGTTWLPGVGGTGRLGFIQGNQRYLRARSWRYRVAHLRRYFKKADAHLGYVRTAGRRRVPDCDFPCERRKYRTGDQSVSRIVLRAIVSVRWKEREHFGELRSGGRRKWQLERF